MFSCLGDAAAVQRSVRIALCGRAPSNRAYGDCLYWRYVRLRPDFSVDGVRTSSGLLERVCVRWSSWVAVGCSILLDALSPFRNEVEFASNQFGNLFSIGPDIRQDYPLNLSILISGGKETNKDSPSNGE